MRWNSSHSFQFMIIGSGSRIAASGFNWKTSRWRHRHLIRSISSKTPWTWSWDCLSPKGINIHFQVKLPFTQFLHLILYLFLITDALLPKLPVCKACARLWAIRAALPEGWVGVLGGVARAEVGGDISFLSKLNCLSCCKDVLLLKDLFKKIMNNFVKNIGNHSLRFEDLTYRLHQPQGWDHNFACWLRFWQKA